VDVAPPKADPPATDGFGTYPALEMPQDFTSPASEETLHRVAARLRERNLEAVVVDGADEARRAVLERLPEGAEVHSGKSQTLEDAGILQEIRDSGRFDFLRARLSQMDRKTQADEMRKLSAAPDFMLGSAHALTEDGVLVVVSATGSQLGPLAFGAGKVILVVGSQKIVPDLDTAFRRIHEHVMPWEDTRLRAAAGIGTTLAKVLLIEREFSPGRTTVVLVRQPIGI
jgi:L-lactate utilization protein LutC